MPQLFFEQIFLNEKKADDFTGERKTFLSGTNLQTELDSIKRSNEEILSTYTPEAMRKAVMGKIDANKFGASDSPAEMSDAAKGFRRDSVRSRAMRPPLRFRSYVAMASAAACLAIAAFIVVPKTGDGIASSGLLASAERAKGNGPKLFIYLKDGNNAVELENEATVKKDDLLQLSYVASGAQYGFILSIDGNGVVTSHFPDSGASSAKLTTTGEVPLDFAYQLDDAPAFERFFFITGSKPFTVASFMENIKIRSRIGDMQTADLSKIVPLGTQLTEITLLK
jgi:hypothetical protein